MILLNIVVNENRYSRVKLFAHKAKMGVVYLFTRSSIFVSVYPSTDKNCYNRHRAFKRLGNLTDISFLVVSYATPLRLAEPILPL